METLLKQVTILDLSDVYFNNNLQELTSLLNNKAMCVTYPACDFNS